MNINNILQLNEIQEIPISIIMSTLDDKEKQAENLNKKIKEYSKNNKKFKSQYFLGSINKIKEKIENKKIKPAAETVQSKRYKRKMTTEEAERVIKILKDLRKNYEKSNIKKEYPSKEFERKSAEEEGVSLHRQSNPKSKVSFFNSKNISKSQKIIQMILNNTVDWNWITNSLFVKSDYEVIGEEINWIPIKNKRVEVKYTKKDPLNSNAKKTSLFFNLIDFRDKSSFNLLKKALNEKYNKNYSDKEIASIYNNWFENVLMKKLNDSKKKAIINKIISDNKLNKILFKIGNLDKSVKVDASKIKLSFETSYFSPFSGGPRLKRLNVNIDYKKPKEQLEKSIPKKIKTNEDNLINFTKELLND